MPPQSRGKAPPKPPPKPSAIYSKSTPNLPTLHSITTTQDGNNNNSPSTAHPPDQHSNLLSPTSITSPSEPASIEDFSLDSPADSVSSDEEEETDAPPASLPKFYHHHSRSHTYLAPTFAPPFYNRPPTPLPPSPSLTSLLRPNFSSQNSRPGTPDPSSDEGGTPHTHRPGTGTQTPNSAAASTLTTSYRTAKPIPRASPQVPTYEYYGFTLYLVSSLVFVVYLLWSFLPSPFLHSLGIYYYPNRWWALAIPAWTVMFMVYIYVALASYNTGYLTLPMGSVECLVDEAANVAVVDSRGRLVRDEKPSWRADSPDRSRSGTTAKNGRGKHGGQHSRQASQSKGIGLDHDVDWRDLWMEGTDAVMDIPIGGVCEILYGRGDDEVANGDAGHG
jgi:phosphatidylinositol glycan class P protein